MPALEEDSSVVELNGEHVLDRGGEKFIGLFRQSLLQRVQGELNVSRPILQIQRHRADDEDAILRCPPLGFNAEQIVLKRLPLELSQPEICSICVGLEKFLFFFLQGIKFVLSSNQETVNSCLAIGRKSRLPEKFGELSGSASTQNVHLKKAILCVNKSGGISDIFSIFAANRGYTQRITLHFYRTLETGGFKIAIQSRQACRECTPGQPQDSNHQQDQQK